jgi:hypothetical protein
MPIEDADRQTVAQAVRAYIAKERISREEFAQRTKLGKSTVDKLVVGLFSEKTVMQIESQLGIHLRRSGPSVEMADAELGGYTREEVQPYVGDYIFARPCFRKEGVVHAFHMQIAWDHAVNGLLIKERTQGARHLQLGRIYLPRGARHFIILSNDRGWMKTLILSRFDSRKRMKGVMLTLGRALANFYMPMAMPIVMTKSDKIEAHELGRIAPGARSYGGHCQDLAEVEEDQFARWVTIKPGPPEA